MDLTSYRLERDGAERLLVLLHGWSAEQHHLAAYVPLVDPDERFTAVCPRAPHDLPDGDGASWYDRSSEADSTSYRTSLDGVAELVRAEAERTGIGPERTVIAGFSQGGFLALSTVLRSGAPRYAGVWAMCCAVRDVDGVELDLADGSGDERPALVQFGEEDEVIPPERSRAAADSMARAGWDVAARGYAMAHSQTIEMMVDAREWLASVE
ncbi:alpha/beta hydrolase [Ilumatobacter sp.]|uniref:alpha/beta hydrolase n=1 Tax=Ilumatobacter sp. TaxID=1967498 RepID=UPI003B51A269